MKPPIPMPPPPNLDERLLDDEALDALVAEIARDGVRLELRLKEGATTYSRPDSVTLDEAMAALRRGDLVGVQIRYEVGPMLRWDVLMRTPEGTRFVRVESELRRGGTDPSA